MTIRDTVLQATCDALQVAVPAVVDARIRLEREPDALPRPINWHIGVDAFGLGYLSETQIASDLDGSDNPTRVHTRRARMTVNVIGYGDDGIENAADFMSKLEWDAVRRSLRDSGVTLMSNVVGRPLTPQLGVNIDRREVYEVEAQFHVNSDTETLQEASVVVVTTTLDDLSHTTNIDL